MARSEALALLCLSACGRPETEAPRCALSPPHELARAEAASFDGVALSGDGRRVLAAWSSSAGSFVRALDGQGKPLGAPVPLGESCRGGVDVNVAGDVAHVGCVRPGDDDASDVLLYTLDAALRVRAETSLGRAGRDGRGIALASDGARVMALYLDGRTGVHALRMVTLAHGELHERTLTRAGRAGSEPALLVHDGDVYALFAETDFDAPGKAPTRIMLAKNDQPPVELRKVDVPDPAPTLRHDGTGFVLTFRDRPPDDRKPELYAVRLRDDLRFAGEPHQVGRANTEGPPTLHTCDAQRLALVPREYGGERYIAVHALGPTLDNLTGGHQFYANSRDFVRAAGACVQGGLVFVAGERRTPADRGVTLEGMRFSCR